MSVKRLATLLLLVPPLWAPVAHAEESAPHAMRALVVTNNRSQTLSRPALHYADDDGAKYYELMRTIGSDAEVSLLTTMDRDTTKLFPELAKKVVAPTKANVLAAAERLAKGVTANTDVYFVFAGHGDIVDGKGAIELEDGLFVADEVEKLIGSFAPARVHVILDSCNSFFVLSPRKPGGRQFATPAEAADQLKKKLPRAGVFLSTSAEAQVYEWSELQSGVFSHAVRSGLFGAADADRNGLITYRELRAFVGVATDAIKNPKFRPQVFARGIDGKDDDVIFDIRNARGLRVELGQSGARRYALRDGDELPWADTNVEAGARATLIVPSRLASSAIIEARDPAAPDHALTFRASDMHAPPLADTRVASRGVEEIYRALFARPFGPASLEQFEKEHASDEPTEIGVSDDDVERMHMFLDSAAADARSRRQTQGASLIASGLLYGAGAAVDIARPGTLGPSKSFAPLGYGVTGALFIAIGGYRLAIPSDVENVRSRFRNNVHENASRALISADMQVEYFASRERFERIVLGTLTGIGAGLSLGLWVYGELSGNITNGERIFAYALPFGITAGTAAWTLVPTPAERLRDLWQNDPSLRTVPRVGFSLLPGGGTVGLSGVF